MVAARRKNRVTRIVVLLVVVAGMVVFVKACQPLIIPYRATGPSPVDISILKPLADYPSVDLDELEARVDTIGAGEFKKNSETGGKWSYGFGVANSIMAFNSNTNAKKYFEWDKENGFPYSRVHSKTVKISQHTEAVLFSIYRTRDSDVPFLYGSEMYLYTIVRVNNIVIELYESSGSRSMGAPTNEALQQIVDALK